MEGTWPLTVSHATGNSWKKSHTRCLWPPVQSLKPDKIISNSLFNCMGFTCAIYIGLSCCSMTRFKQSRTGCCISLTPPTECLYKRNCIIASNLYDMIWTYFSKEIKRLIHNLEMWYEIWFIALCKYFFVAVFLIWLIFNMLHICNM